MKSKSLGGAIAVLVAVAGGLWWLDSNRGAEAVARADEALLVETIRVERAAGYETREAHAGRVVSRRTSPLGFDAPGRVDEVRVQEGDAVDRGQVLATRETREMQAERRGLAARIDEMGARLNLAGRTTERRKKLHDGEHVAKEELDRAVFEQQALDAQLEAARAALEALDVRIEKAALRAPYSGRVVARHVDEGTVVAAGQPIVEIIEDGALEVRVGFPPATALVDGETYLVEIEGRLVEARLEAILPRVDPATRTLTAIFLLGPTADGIASGEVARVRIPARVDVEGFWVPLSAIAESRRGLWAAYGVDDVDGELRVRRREIEVLHTEADRAYVSGTLVNGDRIVRVGTHRLTPGQRVRVSP